MLYAKLIGGLIVLALLAGAVRWVSNTVEKAERTEQAEARVTEVEREKVELAKTFADAQKADTTVAAELAGFRADQAASANEFRGLLTRKLLTREVPRVDPTTGADVPCIQRDPHRYRCMHDLAVTGTAPADCVL